MNKRPVVLIICDGLGHNEAIEHNAVAQALTPHLDEYWQTRPHALLEASGESIGLPEGQMGTSEANHLVIGSGRIVYQNLVKINRAMRSGEIGQNEAIKSAFDHVKAHSSTLHLLGMMSPGGVHSHTDHLKSVVHAAKEAGVVNVSLHVFTDGRDVAPKSAIEYLDDLEAFLESEGLGRIVSIGGRYWGMDRDNNTERIEKHFKTMCGLGDKASCARDVIVKAYEKEITDEFIEPASIEVEDPEVACITVNDAVIATNFRADRARQMSKYIVDAKIENLHHVAMTKYDDELDIRVAFEPEEMKNTLSEVVSRAGVKQLRVTETEKFTHLTFFFNAQKYEADPGEDRVMIDSDKSVKTYDEKPEMRASEIADKLIEGLESQKYGLIITNLVNCDMVGHTGNMDAIKLGVQAVDTAIGRIVEAAKRVGADVLITADHGNAEQVFDTTTNQALTSHTLNPVPFILVSDQGYQFNRSEGLLCDVAPTILTMMGIEIPEEMTGKSFV